MLSSGNLRIGTTHDVASSIYSRDQEIPPLSVPHKQGRAKSPASHDLTEINLLDHQIALVGGTTMALETTRTRLKNAKHERPLSLPETLEKKWEQWKRQEEENQFFSACLSILNDLTAVAIEVSECLREESERLVFQQNFESWISPADNKRVFQSIHKLQKAFIESQGREIRARVKWDSRSNRPCIRAPSLRWI
ncbi:hypothetical protein KXV92_006727 [Aspergillus fumigatus]|nr:hypothetical protein KXV98_005284 [Aspergillus fumigatus]KAH3184043.1 hypothetical protein KXV92_006727 [Aspergillus fumigatus]KAJ8225496.1 hypothetical protein LV156_009108 [Aspergillus fumigatus]KAJ8227192.1 hypothetical protein LV160_009104 [Aspergillus fumigatus]